MLLLVGGCYGDQESQLAKCRSSVERRLTALSLPPNRVWELQLSADYVEMCMAAHGYRMRRESCPEFAKTLQASVNPGSAYDRAIHARCDLPKGWAARIASKNA